MATLRMDGEVSSISYIQKLMMFRPLLAKWGKNID